jgi:hypothetical protein
MVEVVDRITRISMTPVVPLIGAQRDQNLCTTAYGASYSLPLRRAKVRRPYPTAAAQVWQWELVFMPQR